MTVFTDITDKLNRGDIFPMKMKRILRQCFGLLSDHVDTLHATPVTLTGAITKTMKTSGGDFASLVDVQTYLDANTFDKATLTITVSAGTYSHANDFQFLFNYDPGQLILTINGATAATTIFEFTNTADVNPSILLKNAEVHLADLSIDRLSGGARFDTMIILYNTHLGAATVVLNDTYVGILADDRSYIEAGDLTITSQAGGADTILSFYGQSRGKLTNITLDGITNASGTGIDIQQASSVTLLGGPNSISNVFYGVLSASGSQFITNGCTLATNNTDYTPALDTIGVDGSMNVGGALSVGSGDLLADGTVPLTADWDVGAFDVTAVDLKATGNVYAGNTALATDDQFYMGSFLSTIPAVFFDATDSFGYDRNSDTYLFLIGGATTATVSTALTDFGAGEIRTNNVLRLTERAASQTDIAGKGQLWVKDDTPNSVWFTDDAGVDYKLAPTAPSFKSYTFAARTAATGEYFSAGFYDYAAAEAALTQASLTQVQGTANHPYASHAFCVAKAAGTTDGSDLVITVTGTSIDDAGTRTGADSEVLVADCTTASVNDYYETTKKWLGTITYTLSSTGGATYDFSFNYGTAKYEDFGNRAFTLTDFECAGLANANDTGFDIELIHHKATGWTYSAAAFQAGPAALQIMSTLHGAESDLASGEQFAFKRANLATPVDGTALEGVIIRITTGANNSVSYMDSHIGVQFT